MLFSVNVAVYLVYSACFVVVYLFVYMFFSLFFLFLIWSVGVGFNCTSC